jgi:hypothetical protein
MPGRIRVTYQREPDFWLGCKASGEDCRVLVAVDEECGRIAGVACRSTRKIFINGQELRVGYLGQLRVDSHFRGRWLVSRGFAQLKQWHDMDPIPAYLAAIVDGNSEATGVLVKRGRRGFPAFHQVAEYRTLAIRINRNKTLSRSRVQVSLPEVHELPEIAQFLQSHGRKRQFYPVWTAESLGNLRALGLRPDDLRIARRGREIVGVAALWDQSAYKQNVIHGYSGWLKAVARLYNLGAHWIGRTKLPLPGEQVHSAYVSLICIANDEVDVFRVLIRELYTLAWSRQLSYMLVGLDSRDPLLPAALEYPHILYKSRLYLAEWPGAEGIHEQLDGRPTYVDIATL